MTAFLRALVVLALATGLALSARAAYVALRLRPALEVLYPGRFALVLVTLVAGTVAGAGALVLAVHRARKGAWPAPGACLRGLVSAWVLGTLVYLLVEGACRDAQLVLVAGWIAGVYAIAWVVLPNVARAGRMRRTLRAADFVLFELAVFLPCAELALRLAADVRPSPLFARDGLEAGRSYEQLRNLPGDRHMGFPYNSRGFYDDEFAPPAKGEKVVASIADSFAVGVVPHAYNFTTVCEQALGDVVVHNIGTQSIGLPEYLYLLEWEALPLDPDAIVVNVFVGNDLSNTAVDSGREPTLCDRLDPEQLLVLLVPRRLVHARRGVPRGAWFEKSAGDAGDGPGVRLPWLDDPMHEPPTFTEEAYLRMERDRAHAVCGSPYVRYDEVRGWLERMVRVAGDTPLYFVVIPDELQVEDAVWERMKEVLPNVPLDRDLPQRKLAEVFDAMGVEFLDLLPVMLAVEPLPDGRRHLFHLHDTHFNARGSRVAGEALAEFLRKRL